MAVAAKKTNERVKWIKRDQAMTLVDARAKRVLGISGAEFMAKWNAGEYRNLDSDACPGVIELALLAPPTGRAQRARKKQARSHR